MSHDSEFLDRLRRRDTDLLESLFHEVNPYLTRICLANGFVPEEVNELVHQTWERFFSNLESFENRSAIRTFLCGILFNQIREQRRRSKRHVPEEDMQKVMDDAFTPGGWWKVEPANPHEIFERRQSARFVRECLEGLSEQQMAAFVMKEVEEEDALDISQVLGVTVSHLRVLLFRAKEKLRRCLEGHLEEA